MSDKLYPTPHINASPKDFAKTVLMPGDPQRAEYIAKNFLEGARLVNNVRGISGYTGSYKGVPVSVMASGMGMPSIGIYSHELYNFFGVENIMRVGSAGAMQKSLALRDIILASSACTDSSYIKSCFDLPGSYAPCADFTLLSLAAKKAKEMGLSHTVGQILSSDIFYRDEQGIPEKERASSKWAKMGVLAVEMESAALYANAARAGKRALCILTVSDHLVTGESTSAEQRRSSFTDMMRLALECAAEL